MRPNRVSPLILFFVIIMLLLLCPVAKAVNNSPYQPPSTILNRSHGFYYSPLFLEISCADPDASIYYTTNGSVPVPGECSKYVSPLYISKTTVIRAISEKGGNVSEGCITSTFLFPCDIIRQPPDPEGYPASWGPYTAIPGTSKADYEIDPELVADSAFAANLMEALSSLPVVSLVTNPDYLFSNTVDSATGGIYIYTGPPLSMTLNGTGFGWERPVSFEYFDKNNTLSYHTDCILKIHGGHSRRPEKSPKHSFRLLFRGDVGQPKLAYPIFWDTLPYKYNELVLRAGFNNSWVHHTSSERIRALYIQDKWAKETHREMGHVAAYGKYTHLYINGLYWGIYCISEKIDNDFAATHFGGYKDDYDVIKDYAEVVSGDLWAWNQLITLVNKGVTENRDYYYIQGRGSRGLIDPGIPALIDVVSLADYMLLNFFAGNNDWDHHNWVAIRNRAVPGKGFGFYCWDEERILENINENILAKNNDNRPSRIFQQLLKNAEFRRLFADRVQKYCFGNGALTPASNIKRWLRISREIEGGIIAESARWGDYRRDVHRWQAAGPFDLYTYENHWLAADSFILRDYFPGRTAVFINQLREKGLFPYVNAPVITLNGAVPEDGTAHKGDIVSIINGGEAIYYTTDGKDPVVWDAFSQASLSPSAKLYSGNLIINSSLLLKARTIVEGEWSPLTEHFFVLASDYRNIRITEIHYHPAGKDSTEEKNLEFIELKNTGETPLNMIGARFISEINYIFEEDALIEPGAFIVLASNSTVFYKHYGKVPTGEFIGNLSNSGEQIIMLSPFNDTIINIKYGTDRGWPESPDGKGGSLVPRDINPPFNLNDPALWRASYHTGGSPGSDDLFNASKLDGGKKEKIFTLFQNYPNPFSQETLIPYRLEADSFVELEIFNITGIKVKTLEKHFKPAGDYVCKWGGTSDNGNKLNTGIYFYRISVKTGNIEVRSTMRLFLINY